MLRNPTHPLRVDSRSLQYPTDYTQIVAKLMVRYTVLKNRELVKVTGEHSRSFLQGMISNDVESLTSNRSIYAAMLSPQGKYLHDFILLTRDAEVWLDNESVRCTELVRRLSLFRLNTDVQILPQGSSFAVAAIWGDNAISCAGMKEKAGATRQFGAGLITVDPRLPSLGLRLIARSDAIYDLLLTLKAEESSNADYDMHRLNLGVPDGSRDMIVDKSYLLESNFEDLNGVDFDKGCYIGQENTARQKHRGTVRKRLVKVIIEGPSPRLGEPIKWNQTEIGTMRSSRADTGLALIRIDRWKEAKTEGAMMNAGDARITPVKPDWATF